MISLTAEERDFYEAKLKWLRDEEAAIKTALNKGRKEGREEGREEKAIEIAKNLLGVLEDKVISHITGLSEEKIREMRKV
jgi:predicted transposase/invertase (TIGR01784 family)